MLHVQLIWCLVLIHYFCLFITCSTFSEKLLNLHNEYRNKILRCEVPNQPPAVQMPSLIWDNNLASSAQRLSDGCVFRHDSNSDRYDSRWSWIGQNVAGTSNYSQSVKLWFDEYKDYTYQTRTCSKVCGHYTQIVWAKTTHLGCGVTDCRGRNNYPYGYLIVCNYGPGGNYNGQYPYVAGTDDQCLPVDSEMQTQNTNYDYTTFTKARNCLCNECSCD